MEVSLSQIIIFKLIKNDRTILEKEPLEKATLKGNYLHLSTKDFGNAWILIETRKF